MSYASLPYQAARPSAGDMARNARRSIARFWRRYPAASVAVVVLSIVLLATIGAGIIMPFEPNKPTASDWLSRSLPAEISASIC